MRNSHSPRRPALTPAALAAALLFTLGAPTAWAQATASGTEPDGKTLSTVTVNASADASAQGLSPAYPGGQVARGGRAGILGTKDAMDTPFSITSYTNELIQDRHARSVGDVLQNDPTVRVARGFGNFQEAFFIRGFILDSDDTAYNGLYSLLPRQYIATELFERVEVLRGASAFLNGASPNGGGLGGSINLLPKRAPNEPLNRVTFGVASGGQTQVAADIARRFGPDGNTGIRVNAAARNGGTAVDHEDVQLGLLAVGLDWRSRDVRLSGDIGWQDHKLKNTRTNVTLGSAVTTVPSVPDNQTNFAQPWSYSNERDVFGTLRGEWDLTPSTTAWAAAGARRGDVLVDAGTAALQNRGIGAYKLTVPGQLSIELVVIGCGQGSAGDGSEGENGKQFLHGEPSVWVSDAHMQDLLHVRLEERGYLRPSHPQTQNQAANIGSVSSVRPQPYANPQRCADALEEGVHGFVEMVENGLSRLRLEVCMHQHLELVDAFDLGLVNGVHVFGHEAGPDALDESRTQATTAVALEEEDCFEEGVDGQGIRMLADNRPELAQPGQILIKPQLMRWDEQKVLLVELVPLVDERIQCTLLLLLGCSAEAMHTGPGVESADIEMLVAVQHPKPGRLQGYVFILRITGHHGSSPSGGDIGGEEYMSR